MNDITNTNNQLINKIIYITISFFLLTFNLNGQVEKPIGINLIFVDDFSTELVFTDAFKQSREWIVHGVAFGSPWTSGLTVPTNESGYPIEIPYDDGVNPTQAVRTLMLWDINGEYPSGDYRLIVEGSGQVQLLGAASGTYTCPADVIVNVDASIGGVVLEIEQSLASDPISDIKFIYPEYVNTFESQKFTIDFLTFVEDFESIRFMDWLRTNFSTVETWNDRTPSNTYTQSRSSGVAWETIIELCNLTQKDAWINIPHLADDNYITQLATLLRDNLDPGLTIYIEYSNEIWNNLFTQNAETAALAADLGYTGEFWERSWKYTSKRSADIFRIFETVFGNTNRFKRMIASHPTNEWITNQLLTYFNDPFYNPTNVGVDLVAVAPYFGGSIANNIVTNNQVESITISEIMDLLETSLADSYGWMDAHKAVADSYNLTLVAYEGGQHLVGTGDNLNNNLLTEKLIAANRDERMQELYCEYFTYWYETTGAGLFSAFSSHYAPNEHGSWGLKENMNDVLNYKYQAIKNCVIEASTLSNEIVTLPASKKIYPNPFANELYINFDSNESTVFATLHNLSGKVVLSKNYLLEGEKVFIDTKLLASGIYFLTVKTEKGVNITNHKIIKH